MLVHYLSSVSDYCVKLHAAHQAMAVHPSLCLAAVLWSNYCIYCPCCSWWLRWLRQLTQNTYSSVFDVHCTVMWRSRQNLLYINDEEPVIKFT